MSLMPDDFHAAWREALYYYEIGRHEQARAIFLELLPHAPDDGMLLYYLASCAFQLDETDEADRFVREALRTGCDGELAHSLLGAICMRKEAYVEAEECLLHALSLNPQNAGVMAQYAFLMLKTGYEEKARRLMREALRLDPENETVLHYHFFFQRAFDEKAGQEQTIRQYMHVAESDVDKLTKLGLAALDRENYREARECFRQAFLLDPTNRDLLRVLEEVDRVSHPIFFPNRLMQKTGGPVVWWLGFLALMVLLRRMEWYGMAGVTVIAYVLFCVYTWMSPVVYKLFRKMMR
jgi:tetratricopeptide (TPR) repeat protein